MCIRYLGTSCAEHQNFRPDLVNEIKVGMELLGRCLKYLCISQFFVPLTLFPPQERELRISFEVDFTLGLNKYETCDIKFITNMCRKHDSWIAQYIICSLVP